MLRLRRHAIPAITVLLLAGAQQASAAPPQAGGLVQLAPPAACFSNVAAGGCSALASGIWQPNSLTMTPDGSQLFAVGDNGGGAAFDRDSSGALHSLEGVPSGDAIAAAPDGAGLLVGERQTGQSLGSLRTLARDRSTGALTPGAKVEDSCGMTACDSDNGLSDVHGVAYSPDGVSVYAAGTGGGGGGDGNGPSNYPGAVVAFARNPGNQVISLIQCVPHLETASGVCSTGPATEGVSGASDVLVSPDGAFVYVAGDYDSSVVGFSRVTSGKGLGKLSSAATCVTSRPTSNACVHVPGLTSAHGLAMSPDGRQLYVAAYNAGVVVLDRDPISGVLTQNECFTKDGSAGCTADPGLIANPRSVAVSPDGATVVVAGGNGADGVVRSYVRDPSTGSLHGRNCLSAIGTAPCQTAAGLKNASDIVVSSDSRNVYATSGLGGDGHGAIAAFAIEAAPSCESASVTAGHDSAVVLPLTCTDADGETLTRSVLSAPAHGTLGAIDEAAGTVSYTPAAGYAGVDSVGFVASDGTNASSVRTVTIHVADAAAPATTAPSSSTPSSTVTPPKVTPSGGAPSAALSLSASLVSGQRLRGVAAKGLKVRVSCSSACSARLALTLPVAEAKRLHLGRKALTAAATTTTALRPGVARTVTLQLTGRTKAKLRTAKRVRLALTATAAGAGGRPATRSIAVALRR